MQSVLFLFRGFIFQKQDFFYLFIYIDDIIDNYLKNELFTEFKQKSMQSNNCFTYIELTT